MKHLRIIFLVLGISFAVVMSAKYVNTYRDVTRYQTKAWRNYAQTRGPVKNVPEPWWSEKPVRITNDLWSSNAWNMVGALASVLSLCFALTQRFWNRK
jgi:hypothetical protein